MSALPRWVNVKDRMPVLWKNYFVKIDGRKDICRIEELQRLKERHPDYCITWLEEEENIVKPSQIKGQ